MKTTLPMITAMFLLLTVGASADHHAEQKAAEKAPAGETAKAEDSAKKKEPAATVSADAPALKKLAGSYTLVGNKADSTAKIEKAIESAISGMGGMAKNVAKKRLDKLDVAVVHLKISNVQKSVTVGMDDYVVTAPLDGGSVDVTTPTGDKAKASYKLDNASLVQELVQSEGKRENTFRFNSSGHLVMQVRETSPKLKAPVNYDLVYKRAGK